MSARDVSELRERLGDKLLPGGERSWLDLACEAALAAGVTPDDILGRDRHATAVRGRHAWWAALRRERYSYQEIADGAGVDVSTVIAALKKAGARGDRHEGGRFGYAGMGEGAGI